MSKECPLKFTYYYDKQGNLTTHTLPCTEAKCSWWDEVDDKCSVKQLNYELAKIRSELEPDIGG